MTNRTPKQNLNHILNNINNINNNNDNNNVVIPTPLSPHVGWVPNVPLWPNPFPTITPQPHPLIPEPRLCVEFKPLPAGKNGEYLAVVLDESGSMGSIMRDTVVGFDTFVNKQVTEARTKKVRMPRLWLTRFNTQVKVPFSGTIISQVKSLNSKEINYTPSGGTALLDGIGYTLQAINRSLEAELNPIKRPAVNVVIITDGEENSSRVYTNEAIRTMVKAAEEKGWTFIFMGANIDSFSVGSTLGFNAHNIVDYNTAKVSDAFAAASMVASNMRTMKVSGLTTNEIYASDLFDKKTRDDLK